MRHDMSKVLVERERVKGYRGKTIDPCGFKYNPNVGWNEDLDDDYFREPSSLRRPHKLADNSKQLNENLSPLMGFIRSRVGKKWDDVYSEIRANINSNNAVQMHVLQHINQYVKTSSTPLDNLSYTYHMFVVDEKGFLRVNKPRESRWKPPVLPKEFILGQVVSNGKTHELPVYALLKGTWYKLVWDKPLHFSSSWGFWLKESWMIREFNELYLKWKPFYSRAIYTWKGEPVQHDISKEFPTVTSVYKTISSVGPRFVSLTTKELKELKKVLDKRA